MDPVKVAFLFGEVPEGFDLDEPDDRAELLALDDREPLGEARAAVRSIVAEQILAESPPVVWATAERLLALGVDREAALSQLAMAFMETARAALDEDGETVGEEAYEATLALLPLPSAAEIEAAALAILAGGAPVGADELDDGILTRLGRAVPDPLAMVLVDEVLERLIDGDGPLALLAGDRMVHVADVTAGMC